MKCLDMSEEEKIIRKKIHSSWKSMKSRCKNINNKRFKYYGERGITLCEFWLDPTPVKIKGKSGGRPTTQGFLNFYFDMRPSWFIGATIDRIDNDGNYEPANCQWLTRSENVTKENKEHLERGTHFLQRRPDGTSFSSDRVYNGTHNFLGGEIQSKNTLGRIYINNGIITKRVHSKDIQKFLSDGWIKGNLSKLRVNYNFTKKECPHCNLMFDPGNYSQWHGDKCKLNPNKGKM